MRRKERHLTGTLRSLKTLGTHLPSTELVGSYNLHGKAGLNLVLIIFYEILKQDQSEKYQLSKRP